MTRGGIAGCPAEDPFAAKTKTPRGRFGVAAAPAGRPVTASGRLVPSGPERIDLGLLGMGSPDLLYSTSAHENYVVARRVQRQAVVLTRCTMETTYFSLAAMSTSSVRSVPCDNGPRSARNSSWISGQPTRTPE